MKKLKSILLIAAYCVAVCAFAATDNTPELQFKKIEPTENKAPARVSDKPWEHFGKAYPSESLVWYVSTHCFEMDASPIDVDYRIIDDEIWEYRLNGFLGTDIIISSDNAKGVSTIVEQVTPMDSKYYEEGTDFYETWHVSGVNSGSPRDGRFRLNPNFWMLVAPNYGYNFGRYDVYLDFESELLPTFKLLGDNRLLAGPNETELPFEVEHSDNVDKVVVRLNKSLLTSEGIPYTEDVSVDTMQIAPDNTFKVKLSAGRGAYNMTVLGCDEYGTFGDHSWVAIYSNQRDESHQWKSLGTGLFQSMIYAMAWPNSSPTWSEVEIEQATDVEGLYRAVNPFHQKAIEDYGYKLNRDMDFYIEFGPSLSCRDYIPTGVGMNAVNPVHVDNPDLAEGWFETNYGRFSLPGVSNCSIVFSSATDATATPQVKSVRYVVVPAADAAEYAELPALDVWFEDGKHSVKTAEPSVDGKLAFDLGEYDGKLSMVVARGLDETAVVKSIQSKVNFALDGWKKVGTVNFTPTLKDFIDTSMELTPEVYVNPLYRALVRVLDPFKPLDGIEPELIYDFSVDRSVFLMARTDIPVYSCRFDGAIEEVGCHIGISGEPVDPAYDLDPELLDFRFGCWTNTSVRSGYKWEEMVDDDFGSYPRRYGSMLVFPVRSYSLGSQWSSYPGGYYLSSESFSFYAPMKFNVDETLEVAADGQSFAVGDDIEKLRVLVSDVLSGSDEISLEQFIADETLGEAILAENGRSEELLRPQGEYRVLAVAYNRDGEVANAIEATMVLDEEASSIADVEVNGDETPEYFNLQGVRLSNPQPGTVVIVKRGDVVTKEAVRW